MNSLGRLVHELNQIWIEHVTIPLREAVYVVHHLEMSKLKDHSSEIKDQRGVIEDQRSKSKSKTKDQRSLTSPA